MAMEVLGKRRIGRPKRRWLDNIKNGLSERGLSGEEAQDHVKWMRLLTHSIPTTTIVVVAHCIPTTTFVVVAHCIPTTTFVVVDNDLSNLSAVNRPHARNPRDTCAVNRMYYYCLCTRH